MSSTAKNADPDWVKTVSPLIAALRRGHYLLYAQRIEPLQPTTSERPFQEVLIRYLEEERNMLPPGSFLPVLEEQGLMALLDCWVVNQVLKLQEAALAGQPGVAGARNSINLSETSLIDHEFPGFVTSHLKQRKVGPDTLCFEVTEALATTRRAALQDLMNALQPADCSFAISSFTASHAGMALLRTLPVSYVKIDGQLLRRVRAGVDKPDRLRGIQTICKASGIRTIAEQVEDGDALRLITDLGIDYAQGYAVAEPAPFLADRPD